MPFKDSGAVERDEFLRRLVQQHIVQNLIASIKRRIKGIGPSDNNRFQNVRLRCRAIFHFLVMRQNDVFQHKK